MKRHIGEDNDMRLFQNPHYRKDSNNNSHQSGKAIETGNFHIRNIPFDDP